MKKIIRKIIPFGLRQKLKYWSSKHQLRKKDKYREGLAFRYSNSFNNDRSAILSSLLVKAHVLEKGITMPERRLGFGYDRVVSLISDCELVIKRYGTEIIELQAALADLKQYLDIHKKAEFQLPSHIEKGIENLLTKLTINDDNCFYNTREEYFRKCENYAEFAQSRHTVRWFSKEPVQRERLLKAIALAQTAPSACNRQSTRLYVIEDEDKKKICQSIQNGNRGFGDKADKWILITAELGAWAYRDINSAYIDTGIFAMSLLNALHYYGIGACTLNAHLDAEQMQCLQKEIGYPESELPILFVIIGNLPNEFWIAKSRRKEINEIVNFV